MDQQGSWSVAPAYDLTFSSGPGGEHCTMLMGNGRTPGKAELLKLAQAFNLEGAHLILEQVRDAVSQWKRFAKDARVGHSSTQMIHKYLSSIS